MTDPLRVAWPLSLDPSRADPLPTLIQPGSSSSTLQQRRFSASSSVPSSSFVEVELGEGGEAGTASSSVAPASPSSSPLFWESEAGSASLEEEILRTPLQQQQEQQEENSFSVRDSETETGRTTTGSALLFRSYFGGALRDKSKHSPQPALARKTSSLSTSAGALIPTNPNHNSQPRTRRKPPSHPRFLARFSWYKNYSMLKQASLPLASSSSSSSSSSPSLLAAQRPLGTRSQSMAYPKATTSTMRSKLQYCLRQSHTKAAMATLAFLFFVLIVSSDVLHNHTAASSGGTRSGGLRMPSIYSSKPVAPAMVTTWGGAVHDGYFQARDAIETPHKSFHFGVLTDLDQLSKVPNSSPEKPKFQSFLVPGVLQRKTDGDGDFMYELSFQKARTLVTGHNEAGRGAEFSELTLYNERLLTFDDRTGDVFEILNNGDGSDSFVVPRFVITEGSGETDKGMKWEWATVKDNILYMGSMGKAYTDRDGNIVNGNNLWIATLDGAGQLRRINWAKQYDVVRNALQVMGVGYVIIEAVLWSDHLKKWVFLPRRISAQAYDDKADEKRGGNKVVLVSEDFTQAQVVEIHFNHLDPLRGFSSFAFVPGTQDKHVLAIQSIEDQCTEDLSLCTQKSFFMVLDITTGQMLSEEVEYPEHLKFEGLEFVNLFTNPPPQTT